MSKSIKIEGDPPSQKGGIFLERNLITNNSQKNLMNRLLLDLV
jgi:hypothetical protein